MSLSGLGSGSLYENSLYSTNAPAVTSPPRTRNKSPADRLHLAVWNGNYDEVRKLVFDKGVYVECFNELGQTPLFVAAIRKNYHIVDLLLKLGASPNYRCVGGYTATHGAGYSCSRRLLNKIMSAGGDLRLHDEKQMTPIDWVMEQPDCEKRIRILELIESARRCTMKNTGKEALQEKSLARNTSSRRSLTQLLRKKLPVKGGENGKQEVDLGELVRNIHAMGFGKMYFGNGLKAAAISTIPYIEFRDLRPDRHHPSYRCGNFTQMSSKLWLETRVTVRSILDPPAPSGAVVDILISELESLCKLTHPQILLLMGVCQTKNYESLMLVFEHVQLGSLYHCLHEKNCIPTLKSTIDITLQMVDALIYLHSHKWLHCAITSHAVQLIGPNVAKLSAFEYAIEDKEEERCHRTYELLGNKGYQSLYNWLSPEVLNGEPPTKLADLYSLCCLLWELCTGQVPWSRLEPDDIVLEVVTKQNRLPLSKSWLHKNVYHLLTQGLQISPAERDLDFHEIRDMLIQTRRDIVKKDAAPPQRNFGVRTQPLKDPTESAWRPARPTRSLSSSAIQRPHHRIKHDSGHGGDFDKYTGLRKTASILKRRDFHEDVKLRSRNSAGTGGFYRDSGDYSYVSNPAEREFLLSGSNRRSLSSLYHDALRPTTHCSSGLDLSGSSVGSLSPYTSSSSESSNPSLLDTVDHKRRNLSPEGNTFRRSRSVPRSSAKREHKSSYGSTSSKLPPTRPIVHQSDQGFHSSSLGSLQNRMVSSRQSTGSRGSASSGISSAADPNCDIKPASHATHRQSFGQVSPVKSPRSDSLEGRSSADIVRAHLRASPNTKPLLINGEQPSSKDVETDIRSSISKFRSMFYGRRMTRPVENTKPHRAVITPAVRNAFAIPPINNAMKYQDTYMAMWYRKANGDVVKSSDQATSPKKSEWLTNGSGPGGIRKIIDNIEANNPNLNGTLYRTVGSTFEESMNKVPMACRNPQTGDGPGLSKLSSEIVQDLLSGPKPWSGFQQGQPQQQPSACDNITQQPNHNVQVHWDAQQTQGENVWPNNQYQNGYPQHKGNDHQGGQVLDNQQQGWGNDQQGYGETQQPGNDQAWGHDQHDYGDQQVWANDQQQGYGDNQQPGYDQQGLDNNQQDWGNDQQQGYDANQQAGYDQQQPADQQEAWGNGDQNAAWDDGNQNNQTQQEPAWIEPNNQWLDQERNTTPQQPNLVGKANFRIGPLTSTPNDVHRHRAPLGNVADRQQSFQTAMSEVSQEQGNWNTVAQHDFEALGIDHCTSSPVTTEAPSNAFQSFSQSSADSNEAHFTTVNNESIHVNSGPDSTVWHQPNEDLQSPAAVKAGEIWRKKSNLKQEGQGNANQQNVTFDKNVREISPSTSGAQSCFSHGHDQTHFDASSRRSSGFSTISSSSHPAGVADNPDFYLDDDLDENDPNMQLYISRNVNDEELVTNYPSHPMFADRDSILSMEIPSTGPTSLRSEVSEDKDPYVTVSSEDEDDAMTPEARSGTVSEEFNTVDEDEDSVQYTSLQSSEDGRNERIEMEFAHGDHGQCRVTENRFQGSGSPMTEKFNTWTDGGTICYDNDPTLKDDGSQLNDPAWTTAGAGDQTASGWTGEGDQGAAGNEEGWTTGGNEDQYENQPDQTADGWTSAEGVEEHQSESMAGQTEAWTSGNGGEENQWSGDQPDQNAEGWTSAAGDEGNQWNGDQPEQYNEEDQGFETAPPQEESQRSPEGENNEGDGFDTAAGAEDNQWDEQNKLYETAVEGSQEWNAEGEGGNGLTDEGTSAGGETGGTWNTENNQESSTVW